MTALKTSIAAALLSACTSGDELARDHARLSSLAFDVPADWKRTDSRRNGVATAEWQPEDNDRKESIIVIRTELSPAVAKAGAETVIPYLAAAQRSLSKVRASRVRPITTAKGLSGARVELEFVPEGQHDPYRRVHAVLADGAALVHVLYTAREPETRSLQLVLDTIHTQENQP